MALKCYFCCKIAKITQQLGALPLLWHAWVATVCSARKLNQTIFVQKTFTFGSSPLSLSKTLVALLVAFAPTDRFFKRLYGPHTKQANKRCKAYMSLFQRGIQNCSFKISVFMCKSSVYFVVPPPPFRLGPPHVVCFDDGTAGRVWLSRSYSICRN